MTLGRWHHAIRWLLPLLVLAAGYFTAFAVFAATSGGGAAPVSPGPVEDQGSPLPDGASEAMPFDTAPDHDHEHDLAPNQQAMGMGQDGEHVELDVRYGYEAEDPPLPPAWDEQTLELLGTLPVQDGGRVKPLSTYARFLLLRLNGNLQFEDPFAGEDGGMLARLRGGGNRLEPIEWLTNSLFFPETARHYRHFLVEDSDLLNAIGLGEAERDRRARYSYAELEPARSRLISIARQIQEKPSDQWSSLERQLIHLASNIFEYEAILNYFNFGRTHFSIEDSGGLQHVFEDAPNRYSAIIEKTPSAAFLFDMLQEEDEETNAERREEETDAVIRLLHEVDLAAQNATALALLPPVGILSDHREWLTPGDMVLLSLQAPQPAAEQLELLAALESLPRLREEPEPFKEQLRAFHANVSEAAADRGEYAKIPSEHQYYDFNLLGRSQVLYILSFLLVAGLWLRPFNRPLNVASWVMVSLPTLLLIAAITWRSILRARPPASSLYETMLFVTATAVVVALVVEYLNRQKIALSAGAFLGALGMFVANRYEAQEGADTMPALVAVLDTNFWLATHVTTIVIGYAAVLLAAAMAHVYLFGKLFGFKRDDNSFYRGITRMVYGAICFGLFFSLLGTVLGGIWANESWGRFWGWDPKENGALMIVLWGLFMLHARLGEYLKDFGINMASIVGAMIVVFAWWGVNLLGVGLHSYGFTTGIFGALLTFYLIETGVLMAGGVAWLREKGILVFPAKGAQPGTPTAGE
ncbi:MAG: cytochrome c biogenesis protein [Candidatus Hydrogenedentota bacterium]